MAYARLSLSLRNAEDPLHERGVDGSHETVRSWWHGFGPRFAAEIRRNRASRLRAWPQWHLDDIFMKISGVTHYLWRAADREGEALEAYVTKRRDRKAALRFLLKAMKRYGQLGIIVTDKLRSCKSGMRDIGNQARQETGCRLNNRAENSHLPLLKTRTSDVAVPADAKSADLRRGTLPVPQPLQSGTPPLHTVRLQGRPRCRSGAVARTRGLRPARAGKSRLVRVRLTPACR
jgi:transposase-like protein